MGFWSLFEVASMPMLQVLIITILGALMATNYLNLLPVDARKSLNKIVFIVFTPALMFASLAETVTLQDIISWWFMPVNIGLTFVFGGILGWIVVKLLKPEQYLEGLIISTCSSGNLGNILLILVPAICREDGSPFGDDHDACAAIGLSYSSFSMALGAIYIWTYTYQVMRSSALKCKALKATEEVKLPNKDFDANENTHLLEREDQEHVAIVMPSTKSTEDEAENRTIVHQVSTSKLEKPNASFWDKLKEFLRQILDAILEPPTLGSIVGFIFGATPWLRNLIIGDTAPLRVIQDSVKLLGDGTIPCITLILGGNLVGLRKAKIKPLIIVAVICVRYMILPLIGIGIFKAASNLGFLPSDPLYHFILMIQFTLPPAMSIGTMVQLFNVGQDECSVLFLWTYLVASIAVTVWSTAFMWILS
ncbi:protein PIN-LIKES 7-like [Cornus florida]|uniref:protein PIN-LIKES 7-like n=1 Tax=Cornus florida TaxID=4283 RepID=UPI002896B8FD|nr:protein PIN-LIKES 7-like [Cornus florida]XP_059623351.1 protein PIN-LIKES 7-like [Cornus florida]XP_059623352.1 protein PIN-LIKES 7-like [Cornus florida]